MALSRLPKGQDTSEWQSYTPLFKGTTTDPNLGSTGVTLGYWRWSGVDCIDIRCRSQAGGAGIAAGSGTYYFTLPFLALIDFKKIQAGVFPLGVGYFINVGIQHEVTNVYVLANVPNGIFSKFAASNISSSFPAASWWNATNDQVQMAAYAIPITF